MVSYANISGARRRGIEEIIKVILSFGDRRVHETEGVCVGITATVGCSSAVSAGSVRPVNRWSQHHHPKRAYL